MDAPEISVYGEAKGEYTRQLCVFLIPCLETYFLELLEEGKNQSPTPSKHLWQFQNLLQAIPDWNQDKVIRETDRIQKDCRCDYLEELLTAVFIAHTKVLSAIRLTTKQKKLQITIPKIDHFLHRVLSDCARSLWTNAYLFAENNSIEKQKNLRHVSALIQEAILQAIRGLLPVKSILREYLHEDDDEDGVDAPVVTDKADADADADADAEQEEKILVPAPTADLSANEVVAPVVDLSANEVIDLSANKVVAPVIDLTTADLSGSSQPPMIFIDTKPSVTFSQGHVMFDSNSLEANEIHDLPFAEAELREDNEKEDEETQSLMITGDSMPLDSVDSEEIIG
uniref:Uncharacterized protein n=1 Tax=viral metagenome TaxID=1070528 RepID=A0A6C0KKZ3_9ZZZZ